MWVEAVEKAGLPKGFRFHDLRHTGNTWAAGSGASLRELMERMGHSSERAALIYLHAATEGHRRIADGIDRGSWVTRRAMTATTTTPTGWPGHDLAQMWHDRRFQPCRPRRGRTSDTCPDQVGLPASESG
jgi:hypothetical protein